MRLIGGVELKNYRGTVAVWVAASIIFFGHAQANATSANKKSAAAESVTRLPFGEVAPTPGALAISSDGRKAAHIDANGDVVLWDAIKLKPLETIPADGKKPSALALSHDGDVIAIGYFDSRLILRSRREHKVLREFSGHTGGISALAFSPDDKMLASGGDDATAQIWELSTGKRLRVFDSQFGGSDRGGIVVSLGFSGNGRVLVVNEWYSRFYDVDRGTTLWDIEEGIEISTRGVAPPNSDNAMRAGQALGGGGWLLAFTGMKGLMAERLDLCESPQQQLPSGHYAETVAADPQGRWVAASERAQLTFFGMSGNKKSYALTIPAKTIALVVPPDGRSVFALMIAETRANGNEHFIFGRDAETVTGSALYRISVPKPLWRLPQLEVKTDASHCAPTEAARTAQDFRLPDKAEELIITARLAPTANMATDESERYSKAPHLYSFINPLRELYFSRSGTLYALYLANSQGRSGVVEWNPQTKHPLRSHFEHYVESEFRLQEGWGVRSFDNWVQINLLTGKLAYQDAKEEKHGGLPIRSDQDTGEIYRLANGHIERYNAKGRRLKDIVTSGTVSVFSARNGRLAALYTDNKVQVWQMQPRGKSKTFGPLALTEDWGVTALDLSADGNYVQIPLEGVDNPMDYRIYRLDSAKLIAQGALLAPFPGQANRGVIQDTRPHHLAVWDFDKGEIIARLPRHSSRDKNGTFKPLRAVLSDDGRLLASASYDGLVRVWDLKARQVIGEASLGGEVTAMAFDSSGMQLAVGRKDDQILVLQVPHQVEPLVATDGGEEKAPSTEKAPE